MLQKQAVPINFSQGVDTKTDPKQVQLGKFLNLQNSIFTKGGLLQKRNGYQELTSLPQSAPYVTTFNGDLTAIGTSLQAYSSASSQWVNKGAIQPVQLNTLPLIRNNLNQIQCDSVVAANGLICTAYTESNNGTLSYKYVIADSVTGQNIIPPTVIANANATYGTPRVFLLGSYFIIVYTEYTPSIYNLQFIAVSTGNPTLVTGPTNISTSYTPAASVAFDGVVFNNTLYMAWNGASTSGLKMASVGTNLAVSATVIRDGSHPSTLVSVCADEINSIIWVAYFNSGTETGYVLAVSPILASFLAPTEIIPTAHALNITCSAQNGVVTVFYEVQNVYGYDYAIPTNYVQSITCTQAGTVGTAATLFSSVGLASKSCIISGVIYLLVEYLSQYQSTYFLVNASSQIIAKLAYENGGGDYTNITTGYLPHGLPSITVTGDEMQFPYLYKDLIEARATQNNSQQTPANGSGVYAQTGINLASITLGGQIVSSEIGQNLNISGGFLWGYDGYTPVENGFFLFPDSVEITTSTSGGNLSAHQYFYQFTYEWSDNQGNIYRSAPSIPNSITTSGSTSTNTLYVPTLRLTYKTANPVKIVGYRWSTSNPVYYQFTSITAPVLNTLSSDYVTITDTNNDSAILGNNILYTTGGVVENINGPATNITTLFDGRLWLVDAEDQNLLWFSKQVIESTPVEMSDLLTLYVAPNISAQGSSGVITALSPLDDKLTIFKQNSIYYVNSTGPDNTGSNSQYSQVIYVTSTVGCANPSSIVIIPMGVVFQSDKGIWILGHDLSTQYIGAPVESFTTNATVQSAVNIPGTNQVRFTLDTGITLMYDYYYQQWGTFVGVPAVSSTLYQNLHTYVDQYARVFQENPGSYVDGSNPVLMSFTTSWVSLGGLQGYQRAYFFYLLGTYLTPHKLNLLISYDYNSSQTQSTLISPNNYGPAYGSSSMPVYGQLNPYGGGSSDSGASSNLEQWRVFLTKQRCTSFQITLQEVYDPSFGVPAGQGLTLSGLNLVVAVKKGWRPQPSATSAGGS